MNKFLLGLVKFFKPGVKLFFPVKFYGNRNFEEKKSIIIMNHYSAWDPVIFTAWCKTFVHFMYKAEFRKSKFLRNVFDGLDMVPVKRGDADLTAMRKSLDILKNDGILGIFPEGTRSYDAKLIREFHTGAVMLALKSHAPIKLYYVYDKYKPFYRNYIFEGDEISLDKYYGQKITKELLGTIADELWHRMDELRCKSEDFLHSKGVKRRRLTKKELAKLEKQRRELNLKNDTDTDMQI